MTRIALLSGANPRNCKHGPVVRLLPGSWRLNVQGIVDSQLLVHVEGQPDALLISNGIIVKSDNVNVVQLSFGIRGNEEYITVIAEKVA